MSLDRMLTLAGFDKKADAIAALKESKRQLVEAHDAAIKQVERGVPVDEGLMTGLRAALATVASGSIKATKSIARKASELSDNVKKLYQDEKCKIELKNMLKGMVELAGQFEKLEKDAPTILKKDERVREIVKVFRDAMDTMRSDLQARALPPDRVEPALGESEVKALLAAFLAEEDDDGSCDDELPVDPKQEHETGLKVGDKVKANGKLGKVVKFGGDAVYVKHDDGTTGEYDVSEIVTS